MGMEQILKQTQVASILPKGKIKIAAIGEGPGKEEDIYGEPFVGAAGQELKSMLSDAGIDWKTIMLGNLSSYRPPNNKLVELCVPKKELTPEQVAGSVQIYRGQFFHPLLLPEIDRLKAELIAAEPNLIIALGAAPMAVLTGRTGITKARGTITEGTLVSGIKVIGTFHPAAVLRNWTYRVICVADFIKAAREAEYAEIIRPKRKVWIQPALSDLDAFYTKHLAKASLISVDLETSHGQITCISFAPNKSIAITVPFVDKLSLGYSYWQTPADEFKAWEWVRKVCEGPVHKLLQNGVYDFQWLWRAGIKLMNFYEDTLLEHHSLYPELPKSLGFLGSIYTNEASWKLMAARGYKGTTKLEDSE